MSEHRSLKLSITLAIVMIVLLIFLTVGWVWLTIAGAQQEGQSSGVYWTFLPVGTTFLMLVLAGVVVYLTISVKTINLARRQSNFIDSVTHELKTPIASLKLYLQTLNRRQVDQQQQESFFRFMIDDVERLDHLINHMLDAGKMEKGQEQGELEDVQLDELLEECARSVCVTHRVSIDTVGLQLEPCVLHARRVEVDMIFRNLIDNAVKYAGSEPQVEVTLQNRSDGGAVIRIADNGHGIPHKLRRKIFGRFVRLGMELERKKPGTGLGLYIVRTLVKRMKGKIQVHDGAGGTGTVFEVSLPSGYPDEVENGASSSRAPVEAQAE